MPDKEQSTSSKSMPLEELVAQLHRRVLALEEHAKLTGFVRTTEEGD